MSESDFLQIMTIFVNYKNGGACFHRRILTASNHVIRNIYDTTEMATKDSHFRRVWGKFIQISFEAFIVLLVKGAYCVRILDRIWRKEIFIF